MKLKKKAFTLIELILVVAIVAILAGAIMPIIRSAQEEARISKVLLTFDALKKASTLYYDDTGELPTSSIDLVNDSGAPNWNGPYIDKILTNQDNPYNNTIWLESHSLIVKNTATQLVSSIRFNITNIPSSSAKRINDIIDPLGPNPWENNGLVRYRLFLCPIGPWQCIYVLSINYNIDIENL